MKTITYNEIKSFNPCYDPIKYIGSDFSGTLIDILEMKNVPAKDRLWVIVRHTLMSDKQLHLYGLACARMSEKYSTDKRVKECNDIVEKYINGEATKDELAAARSAARSAWFAAESAAWSARSAAGFAESAGFAARSAWSAAGFAESAAWSAAGFAESAAWSAAGFAESAARSAAGFAESAAEEEQCEALINILKEVK